MKVLSLWQPHATLVAIGAKKIETRGRWLYTYRGPLAIHAAKAKDTLNLVDEEPFASVLAQAGYDHASKLPLGAIVAVATLADCFKMTQEDCNDAERGTLKIRGHEAGQQEYDFGAWLPGRYGIALTDLQRIEPPIAVSGHQGLWNAPTELRLLLQSKVPT